METYSNCRQCMRGGAPSTCSGVYSFILLPARSIMFTSASISTGIMLIHILVIYNKLKC